ncbi:MAG: hypothetical protein WAM73_14415 [Desulfobacterales bacterium]
MDTRGLEKIIDQLEPDDAIAKITSLVKKLFPYVSEKTRLDFLYAFTGEAHQETLPGLVHR